MWGVCAFANAAEWRHGLFFFGDLKYPAGFGHFEYVNPDAPKSGEIRIPQLGNFDSLTCFSRPRRPLDRRPWLKGDGKFQVQPACLYSTWIFAGLFAMSLVAELVANDKPIILSVDGEIDFPVFFTYPETAFSDESTRPLRAD